jgi:hypothetical protein
MKNAAVSVNPKVNRNPLYADFRLALDKDCCMMLFFDMIKHIELAYSKLV